MYSTAGPQAFFFDVFNFNLLNNHYFFLNCKKVQYAVQIELLPLINFEQSEEDTKNEWKIWAFQSLETI